MSICPRPGVLLKPVANGLSLPLPIWKGSVPCGQAVVELDPNLLLLTPAGDAPKGLAQGLSHCCTKRIAG